MFGSGPSTMLKKLRELTMEKLENFGGRKLWLTSNEDDDCS